MRNVKEGMASLGEQVEKGRLITFGVHAFALFASPSIEFPVSVTPVARLVFGPGRGCLQGHVMGGTTTPIITGCARVADPRGRGGGGGGGEVRSL